MENKHFALKEEDFFLKEGAEGELEELKQMIIKKEVNPEDVQWITTFNHSFRVFV